MERKGIELIEYFRIIWKWKIFIITLVVVCVVGSLVSSIFLPKIYRASVIFMVSEAKIGDISSLGTAQFLMSFPQKTFERIIKNRSLELKIIDKFKLNESPYGMDLDELDERISVHSVKDTKLIELDVEFTDAELAREIANSLAELALELNARLIEEETAISTDFLNFQVEEAKKKLTQSEDELMNYRKKAQIETLKKELEIALSQKGKFQILLSDIEEQIAGYQARLREIRDQFKTQDKTFKLLSSLVEDPSYQQSLATLSETDIKKLLGFNMEKEEANPVYFHLEQQLVDSVTAIGGLIARQQKIESYLADNAALLKRLEDELATKELTLSQLVRERDLNNDNYLMLTQRYNDARFQVTSRTPELKVVDPAITPQQPVKPKIILNGLVAGMISLILAVFFVFIWEYVKREPT